MTDAYECTLDSLNAAAHELNTAYALWKDTRDRVKSHEIPMEVRDQLDLHIRRLNEARRAHNVAKTNMRAEMNAR